jgi:uncharacterized protein with HEPN domain
LKDDRLYLLHIRDCIDRIEDYTSGGRESFLTDRMRQDAVLRSLQTLAESAKRLSDGLKASRSEVNWRGIAGLRNILVHDYLGVDLARIWEVCETFIPELKAAIDLLLPGSATEGKRGSTSD